MTGLRHAAALGVALMLTACGGGDGSGDSPRGDDGGACSDTALKTFVRDTTYDRYLFPDLLPASVDVGAYDDPQSLLDAMTAEARALGYDRGFSYVTTITADDARFQGENAGFGFRLKGTQSPLYLSEVFETAPAGGVFDRGTELLEIDDGSGFRTIDEWLAIDPTLDAAFGPSDVGVERSFRYRLAGEDTVREVTLAKSEYTLDPVSDIDGTALLALTGTAGVGYLNLRSFVSTADADLRSAFGSFRDAGVSDFIIDLRYNGGGLISVAETLQDLLARPFVGEPSYALVTSDELLDDYVPFSNESSAVTPLRIAFITTGGTASASELTINTMAPYVEVAIIGANTYGKPVGQSALDLDACDLRLRLVTFRTVNAAGTGNYYDGLASTLVNACAAGDDLSHAMSDPLETSTAAALDWLGTGVCPSGTLAGSDIGKSFGSASLPSVEHRAQAEWGPGVR